MPAQELSARAHARVDGECGAWPVWRAAVRWSGENEERERERERALELPQPGGRTACGSPRPPRAVSHPRRRARACTQPWHQQQLGARPPQPRRARVVVVIRLGDSDARGFRSRTWPRAEQPLPLRSQGVVAVPAARPVGEVHSMARAAVHCSGAARRRRRRDPQPLVGRAGSRSAAAPRSSAPPSSSVASASSSTRAPAEQPLPLRSQGVVAVPAARPVGEVHSIARARRVARASPHTLRLGVASGDASSASGAVAARRRACATHHAYPHRPQRQRCARFQIPRVVCIRTICISSSNSPSAARFPTPSQQTPHSQQPCDPTCAWMPPIGGYTP